MKPAEQKETRNFQLEQAAFFAAMESSNREAVLSRMCGDDRALRERVNQLLAAHDANQSLPPAFEPSVLASTSLAGTMISERYKLLEEIGSGGMGQVWMAEQRSPVRRLVALKLIKPGMDSRTVITRFEAERQALALMDHPNIARVFDGGVTEEGRPFFVMELVRGLPVTQYCDQRKMSVRERLVLFTQICQAVQHAHQKGIIHRDIKPTNVLVTEQDGTPIPKVIDFGLAKALGGAGLLTEHTLHTAFGAIAGTPLYTAPEQVAINSLDVDTRADIYALGVLLYELLTGSPPLEQERLKKAAWDEICRVIREEEPARPSLRISTSTILPSLAASRQVEPGKLSGLIKGDLDWIILKSLEKERNRRYSTAAAMAEDIQHHLKDEPVVAAPPTVVYRARKFFRKNRGSVIAVSSVAVALLLGVIGTTVMSFIARHQADRAQHLAASEAARAESEAKARDTAEEQLYVSNLAVAQAAIESGNYPRYPEAREILDSCPPPRRGWEWTFLRKKAEGAVDSVSMGINGVNRDGSRVVGINIEGIRVIDTATGNLVGPLIKNTPHYHAAYFWDLSSDGSLVLVGASGGQITLKPQLRLYDAITAKQIGDSVFMSYPQFGIFSPVGSTVAVGEENYNHKGEFVVRILNVPYLKQVVPSMPHPLPISKAVYSPDGTRLLTVCKDRSVRLWNPLAGTMIGQPIKQIGKFVTLKFSPDSKKFVVYSTDDVRNDPDIKAGLKTLDSMTVGVYDGESAKRIAPLMHRTEEQGRPRCWSADFSTQSKPLLVESECDGPYSRLNMGSLVKRFDLETGNAVGEPVVVEAKSAGIDLLGSRDIFRIIDLYGGISIWKFDGTCVGKTAELYTRPILDAGNRMFMRVSQRKDENDYVMSVADFNNLDTACDRWWNNLQDVRPTGDVDLVSKAFKAVSIDDASASGTTTRPAPAFKADLTSDGTVDLIDPANLKNIRHFGSAANKVRTFDLSPDSTRLVTADDSSIRFYDTSSGLELAVFRQRTPPIAIQFSADGTRLIIQYDEDAMVVWDTRSIGQRKTAWAQRGALQPWATRFVQSLLTNDRDWFETICQDPSLSPMQKAVALETLNSQMAEIDVVADSKLDDLTAEKLAKSRVLEAITREQDVPIRNRMLQKARGMEWLRETTYALFPIIDAENLPRERYQEAAAAADEMLTTNPQLYPTSTNKATILCVISGAYYQVGRYAESVEMAQRSISVNATEKVDEDDSFSWARMAMSLYKMGKVEEARAALKSAVDTGQDTSNSHLKDLLKTASKLIGSPTTGPAANQP